MVDTVVGVCVRFVTNIVGIGEGGTCIDDCIMVPVGAVVMLTGVLAGDSEGTDVVDVCVVDGDEVLHPDTTSRNINEKTRIK